MSADAGTPKAGVKQETSREQEWVQNMRLVEWMREFIKKTLDVGQFEGAKDSNRGGKEHEGVDTDMTGTEDNAAKDQSDQDALYPVLKHVEESA